MLQPFPGLKYVNKLTFPFFFSKRGVQDRVERGRSPLSSNLGVSGIGIVDVESQHVRVLVVK